LSNYVTTTMLSAALAKVGSTANKALKGWLKLTDSGIIIQWGTGTSQSGFWDVNYFPLTFPTAVCSILICEGNGGGWTGGVMPGSPVPKPVGITAHCTRFINTSTFYSFSAWVNSTGFTFAGGCSFNAIAIGY
jgi:hypothetical protein